jgi:hypothetical protein
VSFWQRVRRSDGTSLRRSPWVTPRSISPHVSSTLTSFAATMPGRGIVTIRRDGSRLDAPVKVSADVERFWAEMAARSRT